VRIDPEDVAVLIRAVRDAQAALGAGTPPQEAVAALATIFDDELLAAALERLTGTSASEQDLLAAKAD
jgi:hypothetical protein